MNLLEECIEFFKSTSVVAVNGKSSEFGYELQEEQKRTGKLIKIGDKKCVVALAVYGKLCCCSL